MILDTLRNDLRCVVGASDAAVLALGVVIALSTLAPLRRALSVDPAIALRNE